MFLRYADIQSVERDKEQQEVNSIPRHDQDESVETVTVAVDSGAYRTVGPPRVATHFPVKPTESSRARRNYSAAKGSVIRNYGQRVITGKINNGATMTMPIQVADVNKVLSVQFVKWWRLVTGWCLTGI